jgi:hypothetical protein
MPELTFSTKGHSAVVSAYGDIKKAQDAASKGIDGINERLALTTKESRALDKLQQDIAKRNESAAQRYTRQLADTKRALAGNKNEAELLRKETTRLTVEYLKNNDAGRRTATANEAQLKRAAERTKALAKELANLPPLLDRSEQEARQFAGGIDQASRSAAKMQGGLEGVEKSSGKVFGAASIASLGSWAAGFVTAATAARTITSEMQKQQELIDKRTAAQLSVGEARNILLRTLTGSSDAEIKQAMAASQAIAQETGVSENRIAPAFADAISAIGGDVGAAENATRVAARWMAGSPDQIKDYAGTLLDVGKATKTSDAVTNMGLYNLLGQISRVNEPTMMQQTIPASLVGQASFGSTYDESGALFAAISNATSDRHGRFSATASIRLAQQLDKYTRGLGVGDLSFTQQVGLMHLSPELAQNFFKDKKAGGFGASFEAKPLGAVRDLLLDPSSNASQQYFGALKRIPDLKGLRRLGTEDLGKLVKYNPLEPVAQRSRALSSGLEQLQTDVSMTGYLSTEERQKVQEMLMSSGILSTSAKARELSASVTGLGRVSAASAVDLLKQGRESAGTLTTMGGLLSVPRLPGQALPPEQQRQVEVFDRLINALEAAERQRQLNEKAENERTTEMQKQTSLLQEIRDNRGGLVGGNL